MNFENLYNGDQTLSQSTNTFLNENWMDIFTELKPVLTKAIAGIYKAIAEPIFNKFPYEELFLRDDEWALAQKVTRYVYNLLFISKIKSKIQHKICFLI